MSPRLVRGLLYAALAALVVLHNDLWQWDDPRIVLGLPIGLTYHILYAVVASLLMLLLVNFAWPAHLEVDDDEDVEEER